MLTREEMKEKALKRIEQLGLKQKGLDTYAVFKEHNLVYYSEHTPYGGMLYTLPDNIKRFVNELECKSNLLVYHAIHTPTNYGNMWSLLFISSNDEDMAYDDEMMELEVAFYKAGKNDFITIYAYVYNETEPMFSEYGNIGVREVNGGLIRKC